MSSTIASEPTLIEYKQLRFLIMDSPRDSNLHIYIRNCKKYNVTKLVRISTPSYRKEEVEKAGIELHVIIYFNLNISLWFINHMVMLYISIF